MSRGMEKPPPGEFLIKPYWGGYEKDRLVCAMIDSDLQPYIVGLPRMTGVTNGYPVLDDGRALEVSNVIWCTRFTPNYDWIELPLPAHNGVPIHDRGIVESCPGLYFVGLPFLYSLSSALLD